MSRIPYIQQRRSGECGAACAAMLFRAYGKNSDLKTIWRNIRSARFDGGEYAKTHSLGGYLLQRSLQCVIVRAKDPFSTLQKSRALGVDAILPIRFADGTPYGHFVTVVDVTPDQVVVHDPDRSGGPDRKISKAQLADLQTPTSAHEVTPRIVVLASNRQFAVEPCKACGAAMPTAFTCSGCSNVIPIGFSAVLGCAVNACANRQWESIICPHCDADNFAK